MKNELILFSAEQGNLLIRLLLAHILSDFVLQTDKMVESKKWNSLYMLVHIGVVFCCTLILSGGLLKLSILVAASHWLIDSVKVQVQSQNRLKQNVLFAIDQFLHLLVLVALWFLHFDLFSRVCETIALPFVNYKFSLILLAYAWVYFPMGYFIKFATQNIAHTNPTQSTNAAPVSKIEHGGKLIGQFERVIILTLVLLNQYEAIGFLITGKGIIRFADHDSNLRSEYVLVGTMMSYALAILTGVFVNYMLSIQG